jgi:hypothetical protein
LQKDATACHLHGADCMLTGNTPSLTGQRAKFVAILFLALAAKFKIVVNICHLMSYYFLELLPIFVILNTPVLFPHLIQQIHLHLK